MTNLLLKTKTELFKWLREREREKDTGSDSGREFWEAAGIYIPSPVSIQSSPFYVNNTPVFFPSMWTCSFNIFIYMK